MAVPIVFACHYYEGLDRSASQPSESPSASPSESPSSSASSSAEPNESYSCSPGDKS